MTQGSETEPLQPILVVLVWRGGARFLRALESIRESEPLFRRIVLSITSQSDSEDMRNAINYLQDCERQGRPSKAEVICTEVELPTMLHQSYWINYLKESGVTDSDWIYWLAYDDQLSPHNLTELVGDDGSWPLDEGCSYFGPWIVRHESPEALWQPSDAYQTEVWTAFASFRERPIQTLQWIREQYRRPTYIQMSGSVSSFRSHRLIVEKWPRKKRPMRIEMATALGGSRVDEFSKCTAIVYGRSNSDRASYGKLAFLDDLHLFKLMLVAGHRNHAAIQTVKTLATIITNRFTRGLRRNSRLEEAWDKKPSIS